MNHGALLSGRNYNVADDSEKNPTSLISSSIKPIF